MKQPRSGWFWLLLAIGGAVGLAAFAITGFILWTYLNIREFKQQPDTHDLRGQVQTLAGAYLAKRPQGALVVGLLQHGKTHFLGVGQVSATNTAAPDASTLFEIGSVTKVFTGIALARMVNDGKLALGDTIDRHLPAELELPAELRPITLLNLATHTAGLPRLPDNLDLSQANQANPYRGYTANELHRYLRTAKLRRPAGVQSDYSNLGVGLLGHVLELRAGVPYEQLVREQICQPLGMADTAITLSTAQQAHLTPGHDAQGRVVSNWDFAVLAPAGALRSSAGDLVNFLQANLSTNHPALGPALALGQQRHFKSLLATVGLGWQIADTAEGFRIHWHNGGTGGYVSFIAFDKANQNGIVLLSNYGDGMAGDDSLDDMGMKLVKLAAKISWE